MLPRCRRRRRQKCVAENDNQGVILSLDNYGVK
jgi:hypothetical protein